MSELMTPRELEILRAVARGGSNGEIARELAIGIETVKSHVSSLLRKLSCRDRVNLVVHAYTSGLVPLAPPAKNSLSRGMRG